MNSAVTSGFGGAGRSEKVRLAFAGVETAVACFTCFAGSCWFAAGLQPAARKTKPAAIGIDRTIIVFTGEKIAPDGLDFFEASQGTGNLTSGQRRKPRARRLQQPAHDSPSSLGRGPEWEFSQTKLRALNR